MKESKLNTIEIYFDGASRGNPGISGAGWVVRINKLDIEGHIFLDKKTNNQAEYTGLIKALEEALIHVEEKTKEETQLLIRGDSELIMRQLKGEYAVKSPKLKPLYQRVKTLLNEFPYWECNWIPREENKKADALANFAIDDFINSRRILSKK